MDQLTVRPEAIIVDGNRFKPYRPVVNGSAVNIPYTTIVKGDGKYLSIAAASILAKTYRDDYMNQLAEEYPQYDWRSNKGYPTKKHRDAIKQYGITPYHRKSYNLLGDGQLYDNSMLSMRRRSMPAGTRTSTTSPTCLLSRASAMGDLMEILPSRRFASWGLAMV